jgi:hypothetical protein
MLAWSPSVPGRQELPGFRKRVARNLLGRMDCGDEVEGEWLPGLDLASVFPEKYDRSSPADSRQAVFPSFSRMLRHVDR